MDSKPPAEGANGKQKDPYYFTFFNEKNEAKKAEVEGDTTPEQTHKNPQMQNIG